jgi:uncharacterized protein YdeI (YjbR/CyaY-like superfamily)
MADGGWDRAYEGQRTAQPPAEAFHAGLNSVNRYAILHRIQDARRADTRARRIERFVDMLERGERIHG